jgi:hypothetical protein
MFDRLKTLLRPPETKASRTARLIAIESLGRPRWTPREYAALAREGYVANAIVHRLEKGSGWVLSQVVALNWNFAAGF